MQRMSQSCGWLVAWMSTAWRFVAPAALVTTTLFTPPLLNHHHPQACWLVVIVRWHAIACLQGGRTYVMLQLLWLLSRLANGVKTLWTHAPLDNLLTCSVAVLACVVLSHPTQQQNTPA